MEKPMRLGTTSIETVNNIDGLPICWVKVYVNLSYFDGHGQGWAYVALDGNRIPFLIKHKPLGISKSQADVVQKYINIHNSKYLVC